MDLKRLFAVITLVVGLGLGPARVHAYSGYSGPAGAATAIVPPALNSYNGAVGITGPTNGSGFVNKVCRDGMCPVTAFGAVCDGSTNDTTAFAAAIAAVPVGGTLLIPASTNGCAVTSLTISSAITLKGSGYYANSWGAAYGTGPTIHGSIIKCTATVGRCLTVTSTPGTVHFEDFALVGPGAGGTPATITTCTETGHVATCNSVAHGFNVGDPIYTTGSDTAAYNVFSYVTAKTANTYSYDLRITGVGTGTGGTTTPVSEGLSIGNKITANYADSFQLDNVAAVNFGTNFSLWAQNSVLNKLRSTSALADGIYFEVSSNAIQLNAPDFQGQAHINAEIMGAQNLNMFDADFENPAQNDSTANQLRLIDCDTCLIEGSYVENTTNNFTGDAFYYSSGYGANAVNTTFLNNRFSSGLGANADIHITVGATSTILLANRLSGKLLLDTNLNTGFMFGNRVATFTNNAGWSMPTLSRHLSTTANGTTGTFNVPAGATRLYVCARGPQGGGGACLSGGATAISGGGGAAGAEMCGWYGVPANGPVLAGGYAWILGTGGTAGGCAASAPTAAGNGSASTIFNSSGGGNVQIIGAAGVGGGTCANTATNGAGATATVTAGTSNFALPVDVNLAGSAGHAGTSTGGAGGNQGGGNNAFGSGAIVNASGVCTTAATAGVDGTIDITVYFD